MTEPDAPDDAPPVEPDEEALRRQHEEWAAADRVVDANPTALGE